MTGSATAKLMAYMNEEQPWNFAVDDVQALWIAAINERLNECRGRVAVLDRAIEHSGVERVESLADVVPLLFPHSVYKSYPEVYIRKGAWPRMTTWVDTLSKYRVEGVDHDGIVDVDDWMKRLHNAGHYIFATSGTSGKHSYLNMSEADLDTISRSQFPRNIPADRSRAVFICGPRTAPNKASMYFSAFAREYGHPDKTYFMSDEPMRMADLSRAAELRRAMAAGTAAPSDLAAFDRENEAKADRAAIAEQAMAEALLAHRGEPVMIVGLLPAVWRLVERLKAAGMPKGGLHPDSYVSLGGGTKGTTIPADWRDQMQALFGVEVGLRYGFQETNGGAKLLADGRYHFPVWKIPIILEDSGERMVQAHDGTVSGRLAAFDVSVDGRWGGVVTGDRVSACFDDQGVSVEQNIERYTAAEGGDDKLTCSGTFDAFVRGFIQ